MTDSLREPYVLEKDSLVLALAKRLYEVGESYWGPSRVVTRWEAVSPHVVNEHCLMARECLRVAEWARTGTGSVWFEGVRHDNLPLMIESPITLPPDGWNP